MLYGFLLTIYVVICLLLALIILIQKGKSSMGLGGLGGGTQMLFGGSGGQDIFQKITWVFTAVFLFGSLMLALMKMGQKNAFKYVNQQGLQPKPLVNPTASPDLNRPVTIPAPAPEKTEPGSEAQQQ